MKHILILIGQRLALGLVTLFIVSALIFIGIELLPGDLAQAVLGQAATPETVAAFRQQLGLDQPAWSRYLQWLSNALQGDFGQSLANGRELSELLPGRLSNTLFLAVIAAVIAVPLALILGILCVLWRNSWFDRATNASALTAISLPEFFVAYVLIAVLAIELRWFPALAQVETASTTGEALYRSFLPALTLILVVVAHMMRMTRASLLNVMARPYIEMARLKGVGPLRLILRHALPNAIGPIVNVIALNLAYLIVGVVVVEVVFVYPGLGQLLVDSVIKRDIPVVQAVSLFFAGTYILLNLLADVVAIVANPRLRHAQR
ncbi:ABC transporter permease [Bacterioplanes sanyensis]|uniref:ABC transporter permease n=1 Tax=Bacterioplanes sanyensis TaxID=1249553 RepID=A0A222FF99_9GAMM|nr:ABC transporter permease [Bacterioplanes sanyensis]ASP37312.1 ABC transporter permease [Bacterioplanes sanyensis]